MDGNAFSETEHLKRRNHTLILGLRARLEEIYSSDFPTSTPQLVIDLLQQILTNLSNEISNSSNEDFLSLTCQLVQDFGEYLHFLDNANTEQTPRGLVQILEEVLGILDPNAHLLAWPQADYNYGIIDILPILKNATANVFSKEVNDRIFREYPDALKLISFPRIDRDDILVHSIFGHELGHPIADDFISTYELTSAFQQGLKEAASNVEEEYKDKLSKLSGINLIETQRAIIDGLIKVYKRGIAELVSDCVGVIIFGPSALFAAYEVLITDGLDNAPVNSQYYPPSRMRIRLSKQIMDEESFTSNLLDLPEKDLPEGVSDAIRNFVSHIEEISSSSYDRDAINNEPILREAYAWIDKSLPDAISYARNETIDVRYDSDVIKDEVPELLNRLYLGVPPNEIGRYPDVRPANWRTAILAAWIYRLTGRRVESQRVVEMSEKEIERTHSLTLRAIEYIILTNRYSTYVSSAGSN